MTTSARFSRSCTPLIAITALGALLVAVLPAARPGEAAMGWQPALADAQVERELRSGCQHLVALIESGSPHAGWAVERLRAAVAAPAMGATVQALAHRGLAIAYRTGRGIAADPAAAAAHEARSGAVVVTADERVARR